LAASAIEKKVDLVGAPVTADRDRWVRMMLREEYWAAGCRALAVAGGWIDFFSLSALRSGPACTLSSGLEERLLGGFDGN